MICDSVDQNRKEFFESVGLESDADYGVNIGDFNPDVLLWSRLLWIRPVIAEAVELQHAALVDD